MAQVILENVSKNYTSGKNTGAAAVDQLNLTVEDGEFLVLVGPSGCGKSTTLRLIAGLEQLTEGSIFLGGEKINDVPPKDRDIGMVFQNYALYPHMTVAKNLSFGLELRKYPKEEIKRRVLETAQMLGLTDEILARKPVALSGGQRQRVAVGRAIVRKPRLFLFDEPLSNLDAKMRVQMRAEISKLHARLATTMIYVTHDQVEAMTMGNRIVVMKDGRIQQAAAPLEIYQRPANAFVAGFIGSPPMNFLEGKIVERSGLLYFQETNPDPAAAATLCLTRAQAEKLAPYPGQNFICGLRPEDLSNRRSLPAVDPAFVFRTKIEWIEPMGSTTHLHISTGSSHLIAPVPSQAQHHMGEPVEFAVDMAKARFFVSADKTKFVRGKAKEFDLEKWQAASSLIM